MQAVAIPIRNIRAPRIILRPVELQSVEFMGLRDSIRENGLLHPIVVRPYSGGYEVVAGNNRFHSCRELGHETIRCIVRELDDAGVIKLQIAENVQRKDTPPQAYANHIRRLHQMYPEMSMVDLCNAVQKSPHWVQKVLSLDELSPEVLTDVNRGHIPLESAFNLAKIHKHIRHKYVDHAKVMPVKEFTLVATDAIKKWREAIRAGNLEKALASQVELQPHLRPLKHVLHEHQTCEAGPLVVAAENCRTVIAGWKAAICWVLHQDKESRRRFQAKIEAQERTADEIDT